MNKSNLPSRGAMLQAGQFFGATRGQLQSGGFVVSTVAHASARVVPAHVHASPFLSMLISGRYREWFGRGHWDARPLGMVLRPPQAAHRDEIGPGGAVFLCVDFTQAFWDAMADAGIRIERRAFESRPMSGTALRLLYEISGRRSGWKLVAEALIAELVDEYTREASVTQRREPHWLARAVNRLHEAPFATRLADIAEELDLHPVHVTRMFKRHHGITLSRHLKQLRLHHATRAMLETGEPLAALAGHHGFADQSHLTRELQRGTGWTPHRLRCTCGQLR
ncbi:MAG: AraC family transcriptional regulator [Steroidobacteraceae bacterium]